MPKYLSFALATLLSVNAFAQTERQNAEFESENTVAKLACYYQQDYVTAEKIWQKWAEQGNPRAKSNLGYLYLRGCTSPVGRRTTRKRTPARHEILGTIRRAGT